MKQRYEYQVRQLLQPQNSPQMTTESMTRLLNELAKDGWEVFLTAGDKFFFRREPMVPASETQQPATAGKK